jgi:hypothetical protein
MIICTSRRSLINGGILVCTAKPETHNLETSDQPRAAGHQVEVWLDATCTDSITRRP